MLAAAGERRRALTPCPRPLLSAVAEGHPFAYRRKRLLVWLDGRRRQVQVYVKLEAVWSLPARRYLETIVIAYLEHDFDAAPLIQAVAGGAR